MEIIRIMNDFFGCNSSEVILTGELSRSPTKTEASSFFYYNDQCKHHSNCFLNLVTCPCILVHRWEQSHKQVRGVKQVVSATVLIIDVSELLFLKLCHLFGTLVNQSTRPSSSFPFGFSL